MKKLDVILVNRNMVAGGIETAILGFMQNLKEYVNFDLLLFNKCGTLLSRVPKETRVLETGRILRLLGNTYAGNIQQKSTTVSYDIKKKILKFAKKLGAEKALGKFAFVGQKQNKKYDIGICCHGIDYLKCKYVLKCVDARYKIAFIHCDVREYKVSKKTLKMLLKFDKILCVSKSCANIFLEKYPQFTNVDYLYNFQDIDRIKKLADAFEVEYKHGLNLVTAARLTEQKGHIRALRVLKRLHDEGYSFIWNIVGNGEKEEEIFEFIKQNQMEDYAIMHGLQSNPYPFIKKADLFFLATLHEAAPMVYCEAMSLRVPVFTTNTCSADELVGDLGFVCDNSEEEIYLKLKEIFDNPALLTLSKEKIKDYHYGNEEIVKKFLDMFK
ncbi:MAG: glycosyltransferase [Clostridia bacterium]|nr:glycosyltransferase [Clostridia bacterium]